jgi:Tfp pilus assembly protein PilF
LFEQRRFADAESVLRVALSKQPRDARLLSDLAVVASARGRVETALACCERALQLDSKLATAHFNQGNALRELGRSQEAAASYRRAIELRPDYLKAFNNLGLVLKELGKLDQAQASFQHALDISSAFVEARVNLAEVLRLRALPLQAERCVVQALELRPNFAEAHWNYAALLLARGEFERGWQEYEWRWKLPEMAGFERALPFPPWDGGDLSRSTILLTTEQGLGDEIMFASLVPDIVRRARSCILECSARLAGLFARAFPTVRIIAVDRTRNGWEKELIDKLRSAGTIDYQCALGSLPRWLRSTQAEFPVHSGYLEAEPGRIAHWRARLAQLGGGAKIGLSWRGGTRKTGATRRSLALAQLAPLFACSGLRFVSLQYTDCTPEIETLRAQTGHVVQRWPEAVADYDETAALISALDGVVSVCTAVVHLAGALGKPVWVMAPAVPEWRYGTTGESVPWYPSISVLRQPHTGEWEPVVAEVAQRLAKLC